VPHLGVLSSTLCCYFLMLIASVRSSRPSSCAAHTWTAGCLLCFRDVFCGKQRQAPWKFPLIHACVNEPFFLSITLGRVYTHISLFKVYKFLFDFKLNICISLVRYSIHPKLLFVLIFTRCRIFATYLNICSKIYESRKIKTCSSLGWRRITTALHTWGLSFLLQKIMRYNI
jgi:hypothetical protein